MTAHVHTSGLEARKHSFVDLKAVTEQNLLPLGHCLELKRHVHFGKALGNGVAEKINQHQNLVLHCQRHGDESTEQGLRLQNLGQPVQLIGQAIGVFLDQCVFRNLAEAPQDKWQIIGIDVVEHGLDQGHVYAVVRVWNVGRRRHLHERQTPRLFVPVVQHVGSEYLVPSLGQSRGEVSAATTVVEHSSSREQLLQLLKISFRFGLGLVLVINLIEPE